ncbi:MAG: Uma2 family endonuclease [Chloroflexota bacterium]|nr:Uma2 family endonuclease [Chloroflexota bacterium]
MATKTKLTYADYETFPDDGNRYEIIDGEVSVSPPPITPHQWASGELTWFLGSHVRARGLGHLFYAPFAVRLSPHDVLEPDVLFISEAKMSLVDRRGMDGVPDLCIEIASPSTRKHDRTVKYERYAYFGVPEYWIVDADARTVEVFSLKDHIYTLLVIARGDEVIISRVLPDLDLRASALFSSRW